jgi:hypothetical protein
LSKTNPSAQGHGVYREAIFAWRAGTRQTKGFLFPNEIKVTPEKLNSNSTAMNRHDG